MAHVLTNMIVSATSSSRTKILSLLLFNLQVKNC